MRESWQTTVRCLLGLLVVVLLAAPAGASAQDAVVQELRDDGVYVAPGTGLDERALERQVTERGAAPIYVAVFPDGDAARRGPRIVRELRRPGVYVVATPRAMRVEGVRDPSLSPAEVDRLADESLAARRGQGAQAVLEDFIGRVGGARSEATPAGDAAGGDDGAGTLGLILVLGLFGGVGAMVFSGRRRRRREQAAQVATLHGAADEDHTALGEDIRALDLDVEMPDVDPRAKADYHAAVEASTAPVSGSVARSPQDFEPVTKALEEGRYSMEAAKARLAGREPPERRPPCFFDPRHGPSTRDVEWSPAAARRAWCPSARPTRSAWRRATSRRRASSTWPAGGSRGTTRPAISAPSRGLLRLGVPARAVRRRDARPRLHRPRRRLGRLGGRRRLRRGRRLRRRRRLGRRLRGRRRLRRLGHFQKPKALPASSLE